MWSPCRKGDIEALEKVQKKATKILPRFKNLKYVDRLRACKLPTLHFRRIRGDMMVTGIYETVVSQIMLGADYNNTGNNKQVRQ